MLKTPLVSFIVTSYNYSKYIEKTLESIKNQSYTNFEIIIVDDCSEDNSVEILEHFIASNQDLRITLITHDKNKGQLESMIDGLRIAQGVFVSFIDSDDVLLKDYAKVHTDVHLSASVAFTSSQMIEIDENDEIHTMYSISSPHSEQPETIVNINDILNNDIENVKFHKVRNRRFGGWYWSPNSSAMYRKSALNIILNYKNPETWRVCPDKFLFNLMNLIGGSINIEAPLIAYRRHSHNAGGSGHIVGDAKYPSDKTTLNNIKNNINIRPETVKFLLSSKSAVVEQFGTRGFIKLLLKAAFI